MNKAGKNIGLELLKCALYTVLGVAIGYIFQTDLDTSIKAICIVGIIFISILMAFLFVLTYGKKDVSAYRQTSVPQSEARISRSTSYPEKTNYSAMLQNSRVQSGQVQSSQMAAAQIQSNPLDRKPMSAEKKQQHERNRIPATRVVLLNEEGTALAEWNLQRHTSLIIGKSSEKEPVDIDLSGSAVAQMISKQHAVLNYTEKGWYIDDIDSKNGTRVKKATQNAIMDVKLVGAIEVEPGDIIYIASTMLQIQ